MGRADLVVVPGRIADHHVAVFAGAIAATGVFIVSCWRTASWSAKAPEDWFSLLGAMFTATTALTATARAALARAVNGRIRMHVREFPLTR